MLPGTGPAVLEALERLGRLVVCPGIACPVLGVVRRQRRKPSGKSGNGNIVKVRNGAVSRPRSVGDGSSRSDYLIIILFYMLA